MPDKKDWKTLNVETVYSNDWIIVEHHDVINPSGNKGIYGKVCFKNKAIGIIPLDDNMNTWLIGQYRYTLDEYSWEIPMGGGAMNEDIMDAAKRELKEETGISANQWTQLMKIHTSNCVTDEVGYVYIARDLSYGSTNFDETENLKIRKLPLADAIQMILNGEITDSISIAGLLRLQQSLLVG